MLVQWIIVGIIVLGAGIYLARLIVRAFKSRGCPGCATMPKTRRFLKRRTKPTQSADNPSVHSTK